MTSVLIIRLSAIGDVVMATQVIAPIKLSNPEIKLDWLSQSDTRDLLAENQNIDGLIVWPRAKWKELFRTFKWISLIREISRFGGRIRASKYDVVIDIQGLLKSGIWAWLSGAPERIGLGSREGSQFLMTKVIEKPKNDKRIGSEYRFLIKELGLDESKCRMHIGLAPEDEDFARSIIEKNSLSEGYAIICPFTTRPQKHWIQDYWPSLVSKINNELKLPVTMLGGPSDKLSAEDLMAYCSGSLLTNMVAKTRLRQAAALIKHASLLVGVDTGLTHMGTAFEVPTIAIFGSTRPYLTTDSRKTVVLYKALECSPCGRHPTCGGDYTCMKLISPDEVMTTARMLVPGAV